MFWKYNFSSSAQIETLLQKEDVTLFELMDEDELLQECKAQNRKLIEFLTRAEVLDEMIFLVVNEPREEGEVQTRFKYANLAAELLTADVPAIIDKLVASPNLLDVLYKFLEKEKPLNPLLASFFSKVLGMLVQRRSEQNWYSYQFTCFQVLDFLKSKGDFVELAVGHVGTSAIMDLLLKLICNVEEDEIRQGVHQWLSDGRLVERLVDKLSPDCDPEDHASADNLLCDLSATCRDPTCDNPLLVALESEDTINKMLDLLIDEGRNDSSLTHLINVLLTLLSAKGPATPQQVQQQQQALQTSSSLESSDSDVDCRKNVVARVVAKRLPNLMSILLHPPKCHMLLTAYGQEVERLGNTRLQLVKLIAALVTTNDYQVHQALYELDTVHHLMDLFFKFQLNNFLHAQVEQCLVSIISKTPPASQTTETPPDPHPLLTQLLTDARLVHRLLDAYKEPEGQEVKQIHNLRGYMGHLRRVANTIVQQAEFGSNETRLKELIQGLEGDLATQWDDFVSNTLAEVNRKNEVTPLPVHGLRHHPDSDEDSDDDTHFFPQTLDNPAPKQGFKEMDMDVIGDFRYADEGFKDPEDNLSGPLQRLTTQALGLSGGPGLMGVMDGGAGEAGVIEDHDLFEEMCSKRLHQDMSAFDAMWEDKEKEITFSGAQENVEVEEESAKEKEALSSSDEEDEDEFAVLSSRDNKMEVDQEGDDWADVFDKRGSGGDENSPNPWQSAPMSDTTSNQGWADFGGSGGGFAAFAEAQAGFGGSDGGFGGKKGGSDGGFGGQKGVSEAGFGGQKGGSDGGFGGSEGQEGVAKLETFEDKKKSEGDESFLSSRGLMKVDDEVEKVEVDEKVEEDKVEVEEEKKEES